MAYQFVREPLRPEEADRLCHVCQTTEEKLVVGRCSIRACGCPSYAASRPAMSSGSRDRCASAAKADPTESNQRKDWCRPRRVQALLEPYFALNEKWFVGPRQVQKMVKRIAKRARISQHVTPHVLRHGQCR